MSYDRRDENGSWDFDLAYARDFDHEPSPYRAARPKLDPRGSVRISYVCPEEVHNEMKRDAKVWSEMGMPGEPKYMPAYNDDGSEQMVLEFRTCSCGSTLAMEVPASTEEALNILRREGLL